MEGTRHTGLSDIYSKLLALRGKVRFNIDLKQLREDRLLDPDLAPLRYDEGHGRALALLADLVHAAPVSDEVDHKPALGDVAGVEDPVGAHP